MLSCGELILLSNMLDNPTLIKLGQLFLKFRDSLVDPISPYSNDRNKSFGPQFFNIFIGNSSAAIVWQKCKNTY